MEAVAEQGLDMLLDCPYIFMRTLALWGRELEAGNEAGKGVAFPELPCSSMNIYHCSDFITKYKQEINQFLVQHGQNDSMTIHSFIESPNIHRAPTVF